MSSLNGIKAVEVEEDKLGIPVTALYHIRVPPRYNAVFEVNIHGETQGIQVISGNKHLLEKHPNMYQHEISIITEKDSQPFHLVAVTNLDQVKSLHLNKGEVVGFARPESPEVAYIATTNELNIEQTVDIIPRNWISQQKWNLKSQALNQLQATFTECSKSSGKLQVDREKTELLMCDQEEKHKKLRSQESRHKFREHSQNLHPESTTNEFYPSQYNSSPSTEECKSLEHLWNSWDQQWCDISEVVQSDFLILQETSTQTEK